MRLHKCVYRHQAWNATGRPPPAARWSSIQSFSDFRVENQAKKCGLVRVFSPAKLLALFEKIVQCFDLLPQCFDLTQHRLISFILALLAFVGNAFTLRQSADQM